MIKRRILLVDDEPSVLEGLQRTLRPLRDEWSVSSVSNAKAALELLAKRRFDVIVSDVQMPGMNGADLLHVVKDNYPMVLRVILSGDIGTSLDGRSLNVAHQVVVKPCDSETLIEAIQRAYLLRRQSESNLRDRAIADLNLPANLVAVGDDLRAKIAGAGELTAENLADYMASDSRVFSPIREVYELDAAAGSKIDPRAVVETLGETAVFALIALQHVEVYWGHRVCPEFPLKSLWKRCCAMARKTAKITGLDGTPQSVSEAFAAGLMYSVGQLLLALGKPEEYQKVLSAVQGKDDRLAEEERERFGIDSETLAGWFLERWGFPEPVCEAVAFQRSPGVNYPRHGLPLAALHFARSLDHSSCMEHREMLDRDFLESTELSERLPQWTQAIDDIIAGAPAHQDQKMGDHHS